MSKRYSLADAQAIAKTRGGQCLSQAYRDARQRMQWQCHCGYKWKACLHQLMSMRTWCPACAGRPKLTIADMHELAKERGGKCLSKRYVNNQTKLLWRCNKGHEWRAVASSIRNGTAWCPTCSGVARHTLDEVRELAITRGGKCLSKKYVNVRTLLLWECRLGHRWSAKPINVIHRQTWCHTCARYGKLTIEAMQKIAKERGGTCLSKKYTNSSTHLRWRCQEGHTWKATPSDVKNSKSWCPNCARSAPLTISRLRKAARKRGGECLTTKYVIGQKLRWKCNNGHIWETHANGVLQGSWCPNCFHSYCYSESRVRYFLEKLLKTKFPKNRTVLPPFELDGYSSQLHLAFEYNGRQHYDREFYFHRGTSASFKNVIERDRTKVRLCRANGIKLIVVPYYKAKTNTELLSFIVGQLKKRHVALKAVPEKIDLTNIPLNKSRLEELNQTGLKRGIRCISTEYINADTKLLFECRNAHQWSARPSEFKSRGGGCTTCSGKKKKTIEEMRVFAVERGGKCLTKKYKNAFSSMRWECERGHRWQSNFSNLYHGKRWCQRCPKEKTFELLCAIAISKGGRCVSKKYVSDDVKMEWECSEKHRWRTRSRLIKDGAWCPKCNHHRLRLTIGEVYKTARDRGFKCLSTAYLNNAEKLQWQCSEGHIWMASTNMIRNQKQSGCPSCARLKQS